ncbi:hypothetical protein CRV15_24225 [Streptomyces clavuligerus]|nr:hypothetical protein D1794_24855 [Streptomyces clavuligerus]QCS08437.1 hypothetical protein CRV15_24225 [Streptomyces clavuligerus]QPJ92226.1 hypothetical protein GE265_03900 [Streptomyces clavuligerus]
MCPLRAGGACGSPFPPGGGVPPSGTEWAVCPWWGVQGRPRKGPAENRPRLDVGRPVCRP